MTGLQTRYRLSEATGERRFMVLRFTPLGAHLFLRLSMDALADRTVGLEQIDPGLTSLASDQVMTAGGWVQRLDAMEQLIGSRVADSVAPPAVERGGTRWYGVGDRLRSGRWQAGAAIVT